MPLNKAFLDTTVLTDLLLKSGEVFSRSRDALQKFSSTSLPVYALKEFSAGPLQNFTWFHNKLVALRSYSRAIEALQRMSRTPKRYLTSTAITALEEAARSPSVAKITAGELTRKYGVKAELDNILCDRYRLAIKAKVYRAWGKRRKVTTSVVEEMNCYKENEPTEVNGLIHINSRRCSRPCALAMRLCHLQEDIQKLMSILKSSRERENIRRYQALKQLKKRPDSFLEGQCRDLGDAAFALLVPFDSILLTTNLRDHMPLANALGKKAAAPFD